MGNNLIGWFERSYKIIIIVLLAIGASALVVLASQQARGTVAAGATAGPIPTFTSTPEAVTVPVSILSDSHALNAGSWWQRTVVANKVPGVRLGQFKSTPGINTERLAADVDSSTTDGGWVIVQAGTNDLLAARSPQDTLAGLTALWDGVTADGAKPIAALVPPSDEAPAKVIELNQLISAEADRRNIPLLDVYTAVAAEDGTWADGHSNDGRHADDEASKTMAAAALRQIQQITSK